MQRQRVSYQMRMVSQHQTFARTATHIQRSFTVRRVTNVHRSTVLSHSYYHPRSLVLSRGPGLGRHVPVHGWHRTTTRTSIHRSTHLVPITHERRITQPRTATRTVMVPRSTTRRTTVMAPRRTPLE